MSSGDQMYTNDERFGILHTPGTNTWTLQIKFVQRRDHGMYECQVSGKRVREYMAACRLMSVWLRQLIDIETTFITVMKPTLLGRQIA